MTKFLLAVHVIFAILAVGPVAVAASMFPPAARRALAEATAGPVRAGMTGEPVRADATSEPVRADATSEPVRADATSEPVRADATSEPVRADAPGERGDAGTLRLLHRICRVYAVVGVVVPVFGFATASEMGVLGSAWLVVSIALTALAALVLVALVLPVQNAFVEGGGSTALTTRLAMSTGLFNLLWAAVTVLMIVRPGSTTGA
ncbi:hypothetical protein [Streptomyces sp. NPDC013455]|uniref:hypothetical protein n=1 Tax=Streptomyces sp. NPDC013455 TaxID=3155605 RepID=UPI0033E290F5